MCQRESRKEARLPQQLQAWHMRSLMAVERLLQEEAKLELELEAAVAAAAAASAPAAHPASLGRVPALVRL